MYTKKKRTQLICIVLFSVEIRCRTILGGSSGKYPNQKVVYYVDVS